MKSYQKQGYNITYLNLLSIWIVSSIIISVWFVSRYTADKIGEYQHMKKNYASVNHSVKLALPVVVSEILQVAKEDNKIIVAFSYHTIKMKEGWKNITDSFESSILEKSKNSKQWVLKIPAYKHDTPALYNLDWLVYYPIDAKEILKKKIGDYEFYLDAKVELKDHEIYQILTWAPSYTSLYLLNGLRVLGICASWFFIIGLIIAVIYCLAGIFFGWRDHNFRRYYKNYFLSNQDGIQPLLEKNKKYVAIRTFEQILIIQIK